MGCRACASPGGGCQFLGTAATSQVVGEALGLSLPHTALAPSGQPIWLDAAKRSAGAMMRLHQLGMGTSDILTQAAVWNAMVVHAAFGGSTNLLIHLAAIAYAAGLQPPTVAGLDRGQSAGAAACGCAAERAAQFCHGAGFSGGRRAGSDAASAQGAADRYKGEDGYAANRWMRASTGGSRARDAGELRRVLEGAGRNRSGRCDHVAGSSARARADVGGLFPDRQSCAGGIGGQEHVDRSIAGWRRQVFRHVGPARVFITEEAAIKAIKSGEIMEGDVIVLICGGPKGAGMQEIYQITAALKALAALQACGCAYRRAFQRRFDGRVHWAYFAGGACGRADRQGSGRRRD